MGGGGPVVVVLGASLIRFVCSSRSGSRHFLVPAHTHSVSFFFHFVVFCSFLYIGDFLTVCMIQLYIYTTPACAIAFGQYCFSCLPESRLCDYDIFHALWTPLWSESALIVGNRINGVLSRTYNRQRQNDLYLRNLYLMSRKQNKTKRNEMKREKENWKGKLKLVYCAKKSLTGWSQLNHIPVSLSLISGQLWEPN